MALGKEVEFNSMIKSVKGAGGWLLLSSALLLLPGCFTTNHTVSVSHGGFQLSRQKTLIVGVHDNSIFNNLDTDNLIMEFAACETKLLDIRKLDPKEYRSFFDLEGPDSLRLASVGNGVQGDYLLLGSFLDIFSPGGNLGISNLNGYEATYQRHKFEPHSQFEFILYDLRDHRELMRLVTRTEPLTFFFNGAQDQEYWVHPSNPLLLPKNYKKARKKIKKLCNC